MERLTQYLSNSLFENNYIKKAEIEVIQYGIEMFIICVLEMLAILCLALYFGTFTETLIYLVAFIPIRIYSGGYHAETRLRCFIILLCVFGIFTIINPMQLFNNYTGVLIAIINLIFILLWSPISNDSKPLSKNKRKIYKKRSLIFSITAIFITSTFCIYEIKTIYTQAYILGLLTAVITMATGKIKNFMKGAKRYD